jgi:hypothetical protein
MHKLDIPVIGATLGLAMLLVLVAGSLASSVPAVIGHVRLAGMPPLAVDPGGSLAPCSLLIERPSVAGRMHWRPKRPDCP